MSLSAEIHTLRFVEEKTAEKAIRWIEQPDKTQIGIFPHEPGIARVTLAAHKGAHSVGVTRLAKAQNIPMSCYSVWTISGQSQEFVNGWMCANTFRLSCSADGVGKHVELDRQIFGLEAGFLEARTQWIDTGRWALDGDAEFFVRLQTWRKALNVLRGPGRALRPFAQADILVHDPLPLDLNGVDPMQVRVLSLRRIDASIRTDITASCSKRLIETIGLRFSLPPMMTSCASFSHLDGNILVGVGFDSSIGCAWVARRHDSSWEVALHVDERIHMHSCTPLVTTHVRANLHD
jgi:hypothetical protein